jgi:DNA-binding NarL/FixJ family response regulator
MQARPQLDPPVQNRPPVDVTTPAELLPPDSPDGRVRVLVVDADRRVRAALSSLIGLATGLELVGSAGHPAGAIETLEAAPLDVVVLDPKLPDLDAGAALIRLVRVRWPAVGIVVLTWTDARDASLEIPADRYLPTSVAPADLLAALESFGRRTASGPGPAADGVQ